MTRTELLNKLNERTDRSAWDKAITLYAYELVESLEVEELPEDFAEFKSLMLNGASDWNEYSWGGSSLIYDCDIAQRTCTPSELKKTKGGERRPNSREEWLDVQARALSQAFRRANGYRKISL